MLSFGGRSPRRVAHLARHLTASALVPPPPPPFRKVLVANRGEIALRVFRAAHELGCASAAVFTPADAGALHCTEAGEAHALDGNGDGGGATGLGYLDGAAVLRCAAAAGADAVHPGYGFLSEDAAFAEAVLAAGLAWVGPPPAALRLFGDKVAARAHARAHGVPVAAGSTAPVADASSALAAAAAAGCGWPLLLKAAHGGGGRGIRLVADAAAMEGAFASASREAAAAFGSGELFVEECLVGSLALSRTSTHSRLTPLIVSSLTSLRVVSARATTWRCSCWRTAMAPWCTCTSGSARCSGATRRCSRSRRRRGSAQRCASG